MSLLPKEPKKQDSKFFGLENASPTFQRIITKYRQKRKDLNEKPKSILAFVEKARFLAENRETEDEYMMKELKHDRKFTQNIVYLYGQRAENHYNEINNQKEYKPKVNKDYFFTPKEIQRLKTEKIKIRRYKIGNLIGQGSYGKVYEALDEERGQLIAVKVIDKKRLNSFSSNSNSSISSIESEIEILSKLNHKNIIKYYGSLQSKNHLKIFLEYCEGGSIAKMLLNYKSFTENIIRKYTKEMLEGLEYLHAHSIIHRDIKGANILVDRNGICKLSDFGGAKIIKEEMELSRNYSMKGTPN